MVRLLLIEDELDSRDMLSVLLEAGGYAVTAVESEAAARHAQQIGGYDLVLADLMLGRTTLEDAWSYIDRIVALAKPAPVGLLSGWNDVEGRGALAHGVAFSLRKPCTREQLFDQLATTLRLPSLTAETTGVLREYFACIESGDYDRLRAFLAPDFVYRVPSDDPRFANEVRGIDEFIRFTAGTFHQLAEPRFEIRAMRPLPLGALVEYVGTWADGGQRHQMPGAVMFAVEAGVIRRADVRVNVDELR